MTKKEYKILCKLIEKNTECYEDEMRYENYEMNEHNIRDFLKDVKETLVDEEETN